MADDDKGAPKLHIDSDWKVEAQREKERLAQKEQQKAAARAGPDIEGKARGGGPAGAGDAGEGPGQLPEANFTSLVGLLASQAIMGLGTMADPQTNRIIVDLEGARFSIDLLDVLEQKTKGNLTDEEGKELRQILAELRSRYVQIANLVAKQMAQGPLPRSGEVAAGGMPGAAPPGRKSPLQ